MLKGMLDGISLFSKHPGRPLPGFPVITKGDVGCSLGQLETARESKRKPVFDRSIGNSVEVAPVQYTTARFGIIEVHHQAIQGGKVLNAAAGDADGAIDGQGVFTDSAFACHGQVSGLPGDVQRTLLGNHEQTLGLDAAESRHRSERLASEQNCNTHNDE